MSKFGTQALGTLVGGALLVAASVAWTAQGEPPKDIGEFYKMMPDWGRELPNGRQSFSQNQLNHVYPKELHSQWDIVLNFLSSISFL